ncbi:lytic transglycosylase domain-containing protein [Methylophilus medardicus]|uniref:Lytic transglycosylase domain-containing protein n=1 Tax=Methylophilus medardicus TaxID=2588534 RepID=A0A5B8CTW9_9PROT|nr:lytic transglycosylase domain-containing protein [Methylophilus medardicus]QDC44689.1 lytic transglycosylase domain-containing protein [Methylophilus medardicus]QDC49696.1 lytic transglycosylase domain-containing protein [Methylophilus medardicus]QDC53401.1 lytic transglycosylase domain-containing protein [Methylophilus medardicus]
MFNPIHKIFHVCGLSLLVCAGLMLAAPVQAAAPRDVSGAILAHEIAPDATQVMADNVRVDGSDADEIVISNTAVDPIELAVPPQINRQSMAWRNGVLPYQSEVQAAAQATQVDPALIHAVIATESGYNPRAVSPTGAFGLMQVMPSTAQSMTSLPVRQWSVPQQILWGAHYLKRMLDMFEGNVTLALAAYNAGPQAVKTHQYAVPPFGETKRYVPKVLGYYQAFKPRLKAVTPLGLAND